MSPAVRALRGATTVDADTPEQITSRTVTLLQEMFERNDVDHDDLISILFTVTDDLTSAFPAAAARTIGLGDVPLMCAREIPVSGSMPRCIRVLAHLTTERERTELRHIYLERAVTLRDDLPG
jgi:chorismate mutase